MKNVLLTGLAVISAAAALTAVSYATAPHYASAADTGSAKSYSTSIMNSSFESPDFYHVKTNASDFGSVGTGHGQEISLDNNAAYLVTSKDIFEEITGGTFHWNTTASNNRMEIVTAVSEDQKGESNNLSGYFGYNSNSNRSAAHGNQFAELVAEEESSLYQTISTTPGSTLTWSLMHRARYHGTSSKNIDTMALFIGPEQDGLKKSSSTSNDIFKQMALLLHNDFENLDPGMSNRAVKLYSKRMSDGETVDESSVSTVKTDECDQEWFCWIITSDYMDWYRYADTYKVPSGQEATTLAFTALNSESDGSISAVNEGNLLDDIQLSIMHQLTVSSITGGHGIVSYTSENISEDDIVTYESSPYIRNFEEGKNITITAVPDNGYAFVGAMVDGTIISASDFTANNDGNYRLTMNSEHSVILYFSKLAHVIYDPNDGEFLGKTEQSEYDIHLYLPLTQSEAPNNSGKDFVGWRVFSDGDISGADQGVFIPKDHKISYDQEGKKFIIDYNNGESLTVSTTNDTILFLAEYRNTLKVQSCYVGVDKFVEHDDSSGGTATIKLEGSDEKGSSVGIYAGQKYTVEAAPKPGYEFKGWYYTFDSEDQLPNQTVHVIPSTDTTYSGTFSSNENITIHAQFVEIAVTPVLSVIAEDKDSEDILKNNGIVSTNTNYTHGYGGSEYGNTIATSFHITRDFGGSINMPGGVWTIYLPVNGTFMKVPDGDNQSDYDHVNFNTAVVRDSSNSDKANFGTIYDMKSSDDAQTEKFNIYVGGSSSITLTNATVNFGLIIDNVYAPKATAGFKVESQKPTDTPDVDETNSIYTDYNRGEKYEHDEDILN